MTDDRFDYRPPETRAETLERILSRSVVHRPGGAAPAQTEAERQRIADRLAMHDEYFGIGDEREQQERLVRSFDRG